MNMAIDEAILEFVAGGVSPPTLRLYAWEPACLSLGYAQSFHDVDHRRLKASGWDLVRRPSGGRAILHTDELTYALIAPVGHPHVTGGVLESYRHLSQGLAAALVSMGLDPAVKTKTSAGDDPQQSPICFQIPSAYEITVDGRKLIGSAQVRRRRGVLQHGSLPLRGNIARVCQALAFASEEARERAAARLAASAATLEDLLDEPPSWPQAASAIVDGFANALRMAFDRDEITPEEARRAEALVVSRYGNPTWLRRL
jgi:lipoate-protein ligase A